MPFCRDRAAERIDELVIIISNSEYADRNRKFQAPGLQPTLWASNIGCSRWEGTATSRLNGSTTIEIRTDAIMTSFGASPPQAIFYSVQGVEQWTLGGDCRGSGSMPVNPGTAFLFTHNFTPLGGTKHRGYIVSSVDSRPISGYECKVMVEGGFVWKPSSGILLPPWVFNDKVQPPLLEVRADGTIDGSYVDPEGVAQYTWHFEPKREPDP